MSLLLGETIYTDIFLVCEKDCVRCFRYVLEQLLKRGRDSSLVTGLRVSIILFVF